MTNLAEKMVRIDNMRIISITHFKGKQFKEDIIMAAAAVIQHTI